MTDHFLHRGRKHGGRIRSGNLWTDYCLVNVRWPPGKAGAQLLDVTAEVPSRVDVTPMVAVMVPPIWPEQFGCVGTPPGLTEIV